jgi:hypothetical protein
VVGGEEINFSALGGRQHSIAVCGASDGRIHLESTPLLVAQLVLRIIQVLRRDLTDDRHPSLFGGVDERESFARTVVTKFSM